jgi:RND superfamily putative drug exporter
MVWVTTAVLLAIACLGLLKLDPSGLSTEETYTKKFDSIQGQTLLVDHGLSDTSNTVQVVVDSDKLGAAEEAVGTVDGLGAATEAQDIGDGRSFFEATVEADISSTAAFDIVEATRDAVHALPGADALIGGGSAFYLDTKIASERDNKVIMPIVLVVVFIILVLLLRSLISPLILMGTVVLSFGAALGISTLIFTEVFTRISLFESNEGFAHTDPGFPLFTFVFLVALGIDYNIFLMTRVREETMNHGTRKGSLIALSSTGGVITSAGLVLAATFLVLGSLPLVFLAQLGVAVALGVLLDTMIVRSVLVTAINLDLGGKIWWPSKLDSGSSEVDPGAPERELINA